MEAFVRYGRNTTALALIASLLFRILPVSAAAIVTFSQSVSVVIPSNGISFQVNSGSTAQSVSVSGATLTVIVATGDSLTISNTTGYKFPNDGGFAECTLSGNNNSLTISGNTTVVVTPSTTACSSTTTNTNTPGPACGANCFINTNTNTNTNTNANTNVNTNVNTNTNTNDNVNTNVNDNANVNSPVNTPTNTNSSTNLETPNTNSPDIPPTDKGATSEIIVIDTPREGAHLNSQLPLVTGHGAANQDVLLRMDGTLISTQRSGANGKWQYQFLQPVAAGAHTLIAEISGQLSTPRVFIIDLTPPPPPTIDEAKIASVRKTKVKDVFDVQVSVRGSVAENGVSLQVAFDDQPGFVGVTDLQGTWQTAVFGTLKKGDHTLSLALVDAAGNISARTKLAFTLPDAGVPLLPETEGLPVVPPQECSDGIDNDHDGKIDFPADRGCKTATTGSEASDERSLLAKIGIHSVLDNPTVQELNQTIVAPTAVIIAGANAAAALPGLGVLAYARFLFLQPLLFFRRKRDGWGVVSNAFTKLPVDLAIVRLKDAQGRVVRSTVTDKNGRYIFFVGVGTYTLEVTKPGFSYPSVVLKDTSKDVVLGELYTGEKIIFDTPGIIARPIAIDPVQAMKPDAVVIRETRRKALHLAVGYIGIPLSLLIFALSPNWVNALAVLAQVVVTLLFRRLAKKVSVDSWGNIFDAFHKKPLATSVVRIFEPTYNRLLETQVTDPSGRYAFLVGKNKYYMTVSRSGYQQVQTAPKDYTTGSERIVISDPIALSPVGQAPPIHPSTPPPAIS